MAAAARAAALLLGDTALPLLAASSEALLLLPDEAAAATLPLFPRGNHMPAAALAAMLAAASTSASAARMLVLVLPGIMTSAAAAEPNVAPAAAAPLGPFAALSACGISNMSFANCFNPPLTLDATELTDAAPSPVDRADQGAAADLLVKLVTFDRADSLPASLPGPPLLCDDSIDRRSARLGSSSLGSCNRFKPLLLLSCKPTPAAAGRLDAAASAAIAAAVKGAAALLSASAASPCCCWIT
jgi:hypothetical protein